jgi:hypothetical protein
MFECQSSASASEAATAAQAHIQTCSVAEIEVWMWIGSLVCFFIYFLYWQEYNSSCIKGDCERAIVQIKAALASKEKIAAAASAAAISAAAAAAAAAEERWSADEVARCSKAMLKYPVGMPDRWQKVADAIGSKTADDVSWSNLIVFVF